MADIPEKRQYLAILSEAGEPPRGRRLRYAPNVSTECQRWIPQLIEFVGNARPARTTCDYLDNEGN
jgi:hypothetical protein